MSSVPPSGFAPTHRVPTGGMDAWGAPDAATAPAARLDTGLDVQVTQWWGDWAAVTCSNGWAAWVDGRQLMSSVAPAPPPAPVTPPPTPVYPTVGAPAPPPAPVTPPPTPVYPTVGAPAPPPTSALPPGVHPPALVGVGLVLVGSFFPWVSFGPVSASAWDISVNFLITGDSTLSGFKAGIVLLTVVLAGLPVLTRRPLPPYTVEALGALAIVISVLAWFRINDLGAEQDLGLGLFICLIGGVVMAVGASVMKALAGPKR